jgi:5'-phosphate synthase pdxT subunit
MKPLRIGVLAVQGNFREHAVMLRRLGADVVEVRKPEQLSGLDGLVIPGGESTTFTRLMHLYGLDEAIRGFGGAVFGTCAGMIVLDRDHLGLVDIGVRRNAFGRQVASFETDLAVEGETEPLRAVFIRAPWIEEIGPGVEVLAEVDGHPVLAREGRFLVAAFHPELTGDTRLHEKFLELARSAHAPGASLRSRRTGEQCEDTGPRLERAQRREAGGAGLRPAGAGRPRA